ncbi:FecR domain-containing protein [Pseudoalteromonas sp.]|uniref:FecR domain-containing protein n=1 Tax=Pseudoalteromonas sp. TaxID=53249 RepID=UPI0035688D7F
MSFFRSLTLIGFSSFAALSYADAAKVISQQGDTQWRLGLQKAWQATQVDLTLNKGNHVQTGALSKLALLFRDDSQLRLNQNSFLIVKDVLDDKGNSTRFRLNKGRAWVKSKNIPDKLIFETPSAVAAIRGTDWDIEVSDDGTSKITVLHGEIYFSNEFGAVSVKANEQAIAEVGKAPVKLFFTNASERVQWVSEYSFDIKKYLSLATTANELATLQSNLHSPVQLQQKIKALPQSPFKQAMLADIALYLGDTKRAISLIKQIADYQAIPELYVLWGRAHLLLGKPKVLVGDNIDVLVLNAEVALFNGQGNEAIGFLNQVLEREYDNYDALYLLGRIFTEKEHTDVALNYLTKAKQANIRRFEAYSELATLHTFNNQFNLARSELADAEAKGAHGALVNTALGILSLKQGELEHAKRAFLTATTLAPNYARANTYLAITYYQQGKLELANDTLTYAIEQDDNDPMPYFMRAIFERELANPKQSLEAVIAANKRLPFLKSLNQLANNLQGGTDLGAAYTEYGLTQRALYTGLSNYDPTWAGSQLFVSSQIENNHSAKLSELFKGLLNDPTAFASNYATQNMVQQPGVNGLINWQTTQFSESIKSEYSSPRVQLNGFNNTLFPIAFMAEITEPQFNWQEQVDGLDYNSKNDGRSIKWGIGLKPHHKLNIIAFSNHVQHKANGDIKSSHLSMLGATNTYSDTDTDIEDEYFGVQYAFNKSHSVNLGLINIELNSKLTSQSSFEVIVDVPPTYVQVNSRTLSESNMSQSQTTQFISWQYTYDRDIQILPYWVQSKTQLGHKNFIYSSSISSTYYNNELIFEDEYESFLESKSGEQLDSSHFGFYFRSSLSNKHIIDSFWHTNDLKFNTTSASHPSDKQSFSDFGFGTLLSVSGELALSAYTAKVFSANTVVSPMTTTLGGMLIDRQYMRVASQSEQVATRLTHQNNHSFAAVSFNHQKINNDTFNGLLFGNTTDLLSDLREFNSISNDLTSRYHFDSAFYGAPKHLIETAKINDLYIDVESLLADRLAVTLNMRLTNADITKKNGEQSDYMDNFPKSSFALGANYTTDFYATPFVKFTYFDFESGQELTDGFVTNIGWQQEFINKRLQLIAQYIRQHINNSDVLYLNAEWRF